MSDIGLIIAAAAAAAAAASALLGDSHVQRLLDRNFCKEGRLMSRLNDRNLACYSTRNGRFNTTKIQLPAC